MELCPIREVGQQVVERYLCQLLFEGLARADVSRGQHDLADGRIGPQIGGDRLDLPPVATRIPETPFNRPGHRPSGHHVCDEGAQAVDDHSRAVRGAPSPQSRDTRVRELCAVLADNERLDSARERLASRS